MNEQVSDPDVQNIDEVVRGTYRHFKGDLVEVLHVAHDSEEPEKQLIVYSHNDKVWVRPLTMFVEHVDRGDYHGPRFVHL